MSSKSMELVWQRWDGSKELPCEMGLYFLFIPILSYMPFYVGTAANKQNGLRARLGKYPKMFKSGERTFIREHQLKSLSELGGQYKKIISEVIANKEEYLFIPGVSKKVINEIGYWDKYVERYFVVFADFEKFPKAKPKEVLESIEARIQDGIRVRIGFDLNSKDYFYTKTAQYLGKTSRSKKILTEDFNIINIFEGERIPKPVIDLIKVIK